MINDINGENLESAMNIYLISQPRPRRDESFEGAVVVAKSEDDARTIHPCDNVTHIKNGKWMSVLRSTGEYEVDSDSWVPFSNIGVINVKMLGKTCLSRGVVLASYISFYQEISG